MLPKALVLQDKCFGKNYWSFLDFTRNNERTSGIFVLQDKCFGKNYWSFLDFTRNNERTSGIFVPLNLKCLADYLTEIIMTIDITTVYLIRRHLPRVFSSCRSSVA